MLVHVVFRNGPGAYAVNRSNMVIISLIRIYTYSLSTCIFWTKTSSFNLWIITANILGVRKSDFDGSVIYLGWEEIVHC